MWKQVIVPIAVVAIVWLAGSGLTTGYIFWLDNSYQTVLKENVTSIRAAGVVREALWRAQALLNKEGRDPQALSSQFAETLEIVEKELVRLENAATFQEEEPLVSRLRYEFSTYRNGFESMLQRTANGSGRLDNRDMNQLVQLAESMQATSEELSRLNQRLLEEEEAKRASWRLPVFALRIILLIFGPSIGLLVGWYLSRKFHRSMSNVNITLRDATANFEQDLGTVKVDAHGDLAELQQRVAMVVAKLKDVSHELHTARNEVLRSERLAAVGELAAGIAHELRNPLTCVKLLLQHAAQQTGEPRLSKHELRVAFGEILRMERTIQGLLDFSRPSQLHKTHHDIRDTIQRAINLLGGQASQQNVELRTNLGTGDLIVYGDPGQLHQVFVNLLLNGIESFSGPGVIEVNASRDAAQDCVRIEVIDQGQGISKDILPRLFEPFVSSKKSGTGLGLAICRRIVVQHGGTIRASNSNQGGALFGIELPEGKAISHK